MDGDVRTWMDEGTERLLGALGTLDDSDLRAPSRLPGWSRAHVVSHLHFNAEALRRLADWARTGVENPMYPSAQRRDAEIEEGAGLPPAELRALVRSSAAALARELDDLSDDAWRREVRTRQGAAIPATRLPWMRAVEVAVHAVDLDAGIEFADLPEGLVETLARETLDARLKQGHSPALAAWLTGRSATAPELGPWL
ncbi:maleylpyruvate isomerase [Prauserella rugosa]|uniref:Maleylpyruvate isomerase n=1 Tax=Prauserella rugosa TaxID=43354 RepID=A0A660CMX1_9PSEU|nr:maleylpyruvate isomerase [Prauserella rugosa]